MHVLLSFLDRGLSYVLMVFCLSLWLCNIPATNKMYLGDGAEKMPCNIPSTKCLLEMDL